MRTGEPICFTEAVESFRGRVVKCASVNFNEWVDRLVNLFLRVTHKIIIGVITYISVLSRFRELGN